MLINIVIVLGLVVFCFSGPAQTKTGLKRAAILVLTFLVGVAAGLLAESSLRELIIKAFKLSTANAIRFSGKDFHFFPANFYYYPIFGFVLVLLWLATTSFSIQKKLLTGLITLVIFFVSLSLTCYLISNMMIVECTACDDGTRLIAYNDINYDMITSVCAIVSCVPAAIMGIASRKRKGDY